MYKKIILGLGGSGCKIAELYAEKLNNKKDVVFLGLDSDVQAISILNIPSICMTDYSSLGMVLGKIKPETVSEWFPCDDSDDKVGFFKSLDMGRGANGWRMKGLLSFEYMLSDDDKIKTFNGLIDGIYDDDNFVDKTSKPVEVYILSSLCGGTGSALLFAVSSYLKNYVKSKYNGILEFKAILTCPDIYTGLLSAENKIKAYANTYATLKELNAIDLVSSGYNILAKEKGKSIINFKIGSVDSRMGVLFDSFDPKYNTLDSKIINKVYFIDRIPGMNSLQEYEDIASKILSIVIDEKPTDKNDNIYAGISIAEIQFSPAGIIDYVAKQKTYDDLQREWLYLYNQAKLQLSDVENVRRFSGEDETVKFADEIIEAYGNLTMANRYFEYLALGREDNSEENVSYKENAVEILVDNLNDYALLFKRDIYNRFDNGCRSIIAEEFEDVKTKIPAFKLFDSKQVKESKMQDFVSKVKICIDALSKFQKHCIDNYRDITKKIVNEILSSDGELSLKAKVLTKNSKFLHPVSAVLALSELTRIINKLFGSNLKVKEDFFKQFDRSYVPVTFGTLSFAENAEYDASDAERFNKLINLENPNLIKKLIASDNDVRNDLVNIYENLMNAFIKTVLISVKETIFDIANKYFNFFDGISGVLDEYKIDVKIALMGDKDSTLTQMNVGTSEDVKQKAYSEYLASNETESEMDSLSGEIVFNKLVNGEQGEDIFLILYQHRLNHVSENEVIKNATNSSILRVLHDRDIFNKNLSSKTEYKDLNQALSLVALPLNIEDKNQEDYESIKLVNQTLISEKSGDFARQILGEENLSSQEAIDKYLFNQGCPDCSVKVTDTIQDTRIFAIKKVYNFKPWLFNRIDEYGGVGSYYPDYVKAINVKKEQFTQMWNPHLVKDNQRKSFLPFINPKKQQEYEVAIYKAVLYMLNKGVLVINPNDAKVDAFFYRDGDGTNEVLYEGKSVTFDKVYDLFGFTRENPEIAIKYAKMFDLDVDKALTNLPLIVYEKAGVTDIHKQIMKFDLVKMLLKDVYASVVSINTIKSKKLVDFIYEMYETKGYKTEAENFAKTIGDIFKQFIAFRTNNNLDNYNLLYSLVTNDIKEDYENNAKKSGQKKYKIKSSLVFDLMFKSVK